MDSITKKIQLKRMLVFLDYREQDHITLANLENKTYPSCNGKGDFFLNTFLNRVPLMFPTPDIVNLAYSQILKECKIKLLSLSVRHQIPRFENLLKKCYGLEFIPQC